MFVPYRTVLATPGSPAFSGSALVARLPMSMFGIAIVLAVSVERDSYELAGLVSGAALLGNAAGAPLQARIADVRGQTGLLVRLLPAHAASLIAFVIAIPIAAPLVLAGVAAVAGACLPQFGALVRARWARLHTGRPTLHTAFSLESVLDEVVFVVGPPLVTLVATTGPARSGLVLCLVLTVVGGAAYAAQRATDPGPRAAPDEARPDEKAARPALPIASLSWAVVAFCCLGGIFGSVEVATVGFTDEAGVPGAAGGVLAAYAFGSLLAGLLAGSMTWRSAPRRRFVIGAFVLAATMIPLPFIGSVPVLAVVVFVAGFAIAPTLIAGFSMVESVVPAPRLTEGLAWISTALSAGVALGAAVAGPVIERAGGSAAFWVPVGSGIGVMAACLVGITLARRGRRRPAAGGAVRT